MVSEAFPASTRVLNRLAAQGAALLLSGIVAAIITSPLFDRVFTHHLALAARIFTPLIAAAWISLIWAIRPNNAAALYAIFVIIGVFSVTILPVGLELGVELTRNASASSAALWWRCELCFRHMCLFTDNLLSAATCGVLFLCLVSSLSLSYLRWID